MKPINFVNPASSPPKYNPTISEIKRTNTVNLTTLVNLGQTTKDNSLLTWDKYLMGFTMELYQNKRFDTSFAYIKYDTIFQMPKTYPDFKYEKPLWNKGYKLVGGIDEVGRGAFAGPVVAACVVFKSGFVFQDGEAELINDSKKLTAKQREKANIWIKKNALAYGVGSATSKQIDKFGIKKATEIAFRRAVKNTNETIEFILIDAFFIANIKGLKKQNQLPIIKGDSLSISIAAASIVAKVHRDKVMTKLSNNPKYNKYNWEDNKGYGTLIHREAIKKYGKSPLHRVSFLLKLS